MATAIYVRVSSKGQDAASQLGELERWARAQGDESCVWYRDTFTGTTMDRAGWNDLWQGVVTGRIDRIAVWRLDRLGRTASGLTTLFEDLVRRKVNLVSLRDGMDLSTPAGRLMANVLASVAVYETEVRSERQLAGIAEAKKRGVRFGRPVAGKGNGKRVKVNDDQVAAVVRHKAEGMTVAAIARSTGLSRGTVYSILAPTGVR